MEDRSFYVYAHYRLDTMEPFYIGKGKGNRKDILGRNSIHDNISKKHGHAVVILYDNLTEEEAFFYEREVIEDLVFNEGYEIPCKNCGEFTKKFSYLTNFSFGGEGVTGYNFSEEAKKRLSVSVKKSWENKELRKKQSEIMKKNYEDYKKREKLKRSWEDKERREKYSKVMKKNFQDPELRKKCGQPGEKNARAKSVYCKELNIIFSYAKLAAEYCKNILNCKVDNLNAVCKGNRKSSGKLADDTKLTWKYIEDVDQETLNNAEYIDSEKYEEIIQAKLNENK